MQNIIEKYKEKYPEYNEQNGSIEQIVYMLCSYILNVPINIIKLDFTSFKDKLDIDLLDNYAVKVFNEHIPVQYITGKSYIYNEEYIVTKDVLIPRQDTETLIEEAIKCIEKNGLKDMIDLCTGSGAVGISISKNSNIQTCLLTDISTNALDITESNIKLNAATKCNLLCSDMLKNVKNLKVDILVSNPPYITNNEMDELDAYVKNEPEIALRAGADGLDFYKRIYKDAPKVLKNDAYIIVEIGCMQAIQVRKIIEEYPWYNEIEIIKDINGKDRVVKCHFHKI